MSENDDMSCSHPQGFLRLGKAYFKESEKKDINILIIEYAEECIGDEQVTDCDEILSTGQLEFKLTNKNTLPKNLAWVSDCDVEFDSRF